MRPDLDALEKVALEAGGAGADWHPGCLVDGTGSCECAYLFDEGHAGGLATVHIGNGLPISEGGDDAPSKDYARFVLKHLSTFDPPQTLALIAYCRELEERPALPALAPGYHWEVIPDGESPE